MVQVLAYHSEGLGLLPNTGTSEAIPLPPEVANYMLTPYYVVSVNIYNTLYILFREHSMSYIYVYTDTNCVLFLHCKLVVIPCILYYFIIY